MTSRPNPWTLQAALLGAGLVAALFSTMDLWGSAAGQDLWLQVRAPRVLGAWVAGACLGLAGAIAQSLFRNPLADPYLVGSASGASLGITLSLILLGSVRVDFAFVGALTAVAAALLIGRGRDGLLLAGFVISIVFSAIVALLLVRHPEHQRLSQMFMLGQTNLLDLHASAVMLPALLAGLLVARVLAPALQAMSLGESIAQNLGLPVRSMRWILIAVIALLSACSVAYCGMIAFVGLGAPHLVRSLFGTRLHNHMAHHLFASALTGGLLLQVCDAFAQRLLWPLELPVGIMTALLGGLYLLLLLRRRA